MYGIRYRQQVLVTDFNTRCHESWNNGHLEEFGTI